MAKPISISLTPNTEKDDVRLALRLIFQPWKWKKGKAVGELEGKLKDYFKVKDVVTFNSGRSALFSILKNLNLPKGSEVLLQAFTCTAAANPILWLGLKPIYVDCDTESFNIDITDLERKITHNSKVLMVQHTFGLPVNIDAIAGLLKRYNMILIEDCAHSFDAEYKGQKTGTFGKAGFVSFSRDKNISSVYGGAVITNDSALAGGIRKDQETFGSPSLFWIKQQLLHPILLSYIILPLYNVLDLGKVFLVLSQWLGILSKAVHKKEKKGLMPDYFPKNYPNALAILALNQFKKIDRFYSHRKEISNYYFEKLKNTGYSLPVIPSDVKHSLLRFTIKHPKAHEIIYEAWHKKNIIIGDWYTTPIIPYDTNLKSIGYEIGSCPNAESLAKQTFNLPTHINISLKDAEKIVNFLK